MADAPGNSFDTFDADGAFLLDDNLSISVDGLYAILDEQPLPPPDDQSQVTLECLDKSKLAGGPANPDNAFQPHAGLLEPSAHREFSETLGYQWGPSNVMGVSGCKKEMNLGISFGCEGSFDCHFFPMSGDTMNLVGSSYDSLTGSNFDNPQLQCLQNCSFNDAVETDLNFSKYADFGHGLYLDNDQKDIDQMRAENSLQKRVTEHEYYADDSSHNMINEKSGLTDGKRFDDRRATGKESLLEEKSLCPYSSMDLDSTFLNMINSKSNTTETTNIMYNACGSGSLLYGESPTSGSINGLGNTQLPHLSHQNEVIVQRKYEKYGRHPIQSSSRSSAVELETGLESVGSLLQDFPVVDGDEPLPDTCAEQCHLDDFSLKSESSIDSSPLPSSRNSTSDDAHVFVIDESEEWVPDSLTNPHNNWQKTLTKIEIDQVHESHYKQHNGPNQSNDDALKRNCMTSCISVDDDADICILDDISNFARPLLPPVNVKNHTMLEHSGFVETCQPRYMGMKLKANDERLTFRLALQDLSQPKSEASPPEGVLAVPLLRHQRIALSWMVNKETVGPHCSGGILADDQGLGKTISTIALILMERSPPPKSSSSMGKQDRLEALNLDDDDDDDGNDNASEIDGPKQPRISSLSEVTGSKRKENSVITVMSRPAAGTLVVCPTSVLRQWAEELKTRVTSRANLSYLVYHGSNRTKDPHELTQYDVVLTTYAIVSMEVPKQPLGGKDDEEKGKPESLMGHTSDKKRKGSPNSMKKSTQSALLKSAARPLARVGWFRVILDEAQSIKNYRTQVARACWGLRAKRRWCLSGTPIQNAVDDLYSYFRFLRYDPLATYKTFCSVIKTPISRNPTNGYKKLQAVLKTVMLRRTKGSMIDGKPIITLPTKTITLKKVEFSEEERTFYSNLEAESREQFKVYANEGTVKQNYVNILLMLLRLRQACDHRLLVNGYDSNSVRRSSIEMLTKHPKEKQKFLLSCLEASLAICTICNDPPEDAVVTICGHVFCNQCISEHLNGDDNICPSADCKVQLDVASVFSRNTLVSSICELPVEECCSSGCGSAMVHAAETCGNRLSSYSSKVKAAVEILQSLPKSQCSLPNCKLEKLIEETDGSLQNQICSVDTDDRKSSNQNCHPSEKAIVFSQWTRMLDLLEVPLKDSCIQYRRLDGTMSVAARERAIKDFNMLPEVTVMIMSLKAASLGLNLVVACHVLLLDLWWNPTTEDQAIDRAHRIGQTRPVTVSRLTVKDTVEDRILALQEKKREMVASAFGEDESGAGQTRLTLDDLNYLFRV
ncbi:SNF2 family N-terminal domain [Musa troglodytarum]|uniref:SNF2 family N-terminal domain n=1 Tax=Musa troglodytarum TaxID=320322 RepID=A0A9E7EGU4_9LILI|nr:SNF2 family N-terminal domain [Musa troglodytarum]